MFKEKYNHGTMYCVIWYMKLYLFLEFFKGKKHVKDLPAKLSKEAEISMDLIQYKLSNTVLDTRQYL